MPWCGLVCQQGADRGDALPYVRIVRRAAILLVLGGVYACVPRPGRHTICVFPPLVLSFAAKAVGGQGHHVARGREVGEYGWALFGSRVRSRGRPFLAWLVASWAIA